MFTLAFTQQLQSIYVFVLFSLNLLLDVIWSFFYFSLQMFNVKQMWVLFWQNMQMGFELMASSAAWLIPEHGSSMLWHNRHWQLGMDNELWSTGKPYIKTTLLIRSHRHWPVSQSYSAFELNFENIHWIDQYSSNPKVVLLLRCNCMWISLWRLYAKDDFTDKLALYSIHHGEKQFTLFVSCSLCNLAEVRNLHLIHRRQTLQTSDEFYL